MSISAGTDTYGRVKVVGGIPIVTKFAMLQALPLYPIQSIYYLGLGSRESSGIPFLASSHSWAIQGIPLSRVDRISVAMAYMRGILGAMVVVGFISIVPLIMYLTGERLDKFAMVITKVLVVCFLAGIIGGLLSYLIPITSQRERRIREYCGELLGLCIDPARVVVDASIAIEASAATPVSGESRDRRRCEMVRRLIAVRAKIAQGIDVPAMEAETDNLLAHLTQLEKGSSPPHVNNQAIHAH